jgi:hypothetical protein
MGRVQYDQAHMARGIHGLPKVSPRTTLADHSTPYRQATPETALWLFQGWPTQRAGSLRPSFTHLDTPRSTGLNMTAQTRLFRRDFQQPRFRPISKLTKNGELVWKDLKNTKSMGPTPVF